MANHIGGMLASRDHIHHRKGYGKSGYSLSGWLLTREQRLSPAHPARMCTRTSRNLVILTRICYTYEILQYIFAKQEICVRLSSR